LEKNSTHLEVVALALFDGKGRVLMHRRPEGKAHAGLWEFPGGKVESDENQEVALIREIGEELGIELAEDDLARSACAETGPDEPGNAIVIQLYTADRWRGIPVALEGGAVGWFTTQEVHELDKPPLDVALLDQLFPLGKS
jgi:8-oxo-dGTP diphosphatase